LVWTALANLQRDMEAQLGLFLQTIKTEVFSKNEVYGNMPVGVKVGGNVGTGDRAGIVGRGLTLAGVPLGNDDFKLNVVVSEVDRVCGLIDPIHTLLSMVDAQDAAFQVHRLSLRHRLDYLAQVVSPLTPGVLGAYARADAALRRAEVATVGINVYDAEPEHCSAPDLARRRAQLPVRFGGIGLPRVADIAFAAYVGAIEMVLPRFGDLARSDGSTRRGLADHLTRFVGTAADFLEPVGRYSTFLASGSPESVAFKHAWDAMRLEAGAEEGTVFSLAAADAPGACHPDDLDHRPSPSGNPRLQRLCTRQRARARARDVAQDFARLDPNDPLREAYNAKPVGSFFTSLPTPTTRASGQELCSMIAIYMGLSDPMLEAHDGVVFEDRTDQNGRLWRTLDRFGRSLSLYMGKGHGKVRLHNEIENACVSLAKCVRFNVVQQPLDLFASAIHVDRQREFLAAQRRHCTTHAGLVPDWVIKNFVRPGQPGVVPVDVLYDVKGIGRSPYYYGPARLESAPDIRAAKVPGEYEKKALATDRAFNGQGVPGPVLLRLRAYPPVVGLAVGAYGEWSKTMDRFISDVAAKGSEIPERFGCCHGPEHAQGVIASFARTLLGRTALRGVARLRLKALDAITVNCGHDHAPGFADAAGAANAWDVSGDVAFAPLPTQGC
jgi:hypothetical protein